MSARHVMAFVILLLVLLIPAGLFGSIPVAKAQSSQTCTPTTCEAIQPPINVIGYAAVQSDPQPPVFGGLMYVANTGSDTVSAIMNVTNLANITVGPSPGEPMYDTFNGYLYVPNAGGDNVSVISGTSLDSTVQVGQSPGTPAFDPENELVYVPNTGGCSVSYSGATCGDTVSVISGTSVVATVTVGTAPQTPAVNSDPNSRYYGDVYVPNAVVGADGNATVSVISGKDNSVIATINIGSAPAGGAFFDPHNDVVYAADAMIQGTSVVGLTTAPCNADCIYDPYNQLIYTPGAGYPPVMQENGASQPINCVSCGGDPVFDPVNGWVYWGGYAVSDTTPFGVLSGGPATGPNSFSPNFAEVYASCGRCYYINSAGAETFGYVAYVFGNSCVQPGTGYYYVDPALTICNGESGAGPTSLSTATVNPLPNVLGSHVFNIVIDGGISIGYGSFLAFSTTNVVGNTQWQYVGVSFKITGPDGQTGWTTLSIPKAKVAQLVSFAAFASLLPGSMNQWKVTVFFDGVPAPAYIQYDDDNVYVSFPCHFSNHTIGIVFAPPGAPEAVGFAANSTAVTITTAPVTASSTTTSSITTSSLATQTSTTFNSTTSSSSSAPSQSTSSASTTSTASSGSSIALLPSFGALIAVNAAALIAVAVFAFRPRRAGVPLRQ